MGKLFWPTSKFLSRNWHAGYTSLPAISLLSVNNKHLCNGWYQDSYRYGPTNAEHLRRNQVENMYNLELLLMKGKCSFKRFQTWKERIEVLTSITVTRVSSACYIRSLEHKNQRLNIQYERFKITNAFIS
jgi:hypothetical protein